MSGLITIGPHDCDTESLCGVINIHVHAVYGCITLCTFDEEILYCMPKTMTMTHITIYTRDVTCMMI